MSSGAVNIAARSIYKETIRSDYCYCHLISASSIKTKIMTWIFQSGIGFGVQTNGRLILPVSFINKCFCLPLL